MGVPLLLEIKSSRNSVKKNAAPVDTETIKLHGTAQKKLPLVPNKGFFCKQVPFFGLRKNAKVKDGFFSIKSNILRTPLTLNYCNNLMIGETFISDCTYPVDILRAGCIIPISHNNHKYSFKKVTKSLSRNYWNHQTNVTEQEARFKENIKEVTEFLVFNSSFEAQSKALRMFASGDFSHAILGKATGDMSKNIESSISRYGNSLADRDNTSMLQALGQTRNHMEKEAAK
jgi:hypothetical protein